MVDVDALRDEPLADHAVERITGNGGDERNAGAQPRRGRGNDRVGAADVLIERVAQAEVALDLNST